MVVAYLPSAAQDCPCTTQFDFLTQKIAVNYAGYADKTAGAAADSLAVFTKKHRESAERISSADTACWNLCGQWLSWFNDKHLYLNRNQEPELPPEAIRKQYAQEEQIPLKESEVVAYLQKGDTHPIEGIWLMNEGRYRVALIKKPTVNRTFAGVILQSDSTYWMPGQVKFELGMPDSAGVYPARFFMRDHSARQLTAQLTGNTLQFEGLTHWKRLSPGAPWQWPASDPNPYALSSVDDSTLLLRLPTMNDRYWRTLDSLFKAEKKRLEKTPYWIIDCRNNGGGSDITFQPLLPYLYANPVKLHRMQTWCTPDNAGKYAELKKDKNQPWLNRRQFAHIERKMRRNEGQFIGKRANYTYKQQKVRPLPRRVVVLTNEGCASSCEQFVLYAGQSSKVKLMGKSTGGVLDYANLHHLAFPCGQWEIWYPTSRSFRVPEGKGIDNIGLQPDILLGPNDNDWVEEARALLRDGW